MSALEFFGSEFTFSQLTGAARVFEWVFSRAGAPMDVSGVTLDGVVMDGAGGVWPVVVEHMAAVRGGVRVVFPRLDVAGTYDYEIRYVTADGVAGRVVYGRIGVLSTALVLEQLEGAESGEAQRMLVKLPREAGGQVQLEWMASNVSLAAAQMALDAAEKLEGVDATLGQLAAQVEEFHVFTARWRNEVAKVLVLNPVTGTIWVGGYDTGQPYRGDSGRPPRVNAYGFWEVFENGQWVTLPERAAGADGLDGAQVRRVLLDSIADLPTEEERGVYYYTPREAGGYDMWCWTENAGWVCFGGDPYGFATETSLGLVMLGTGLEVQGGAPVGLDALRRMAVALASSTVPGVVKVSSDDRSEGGGRIHISASGSLFADMATFVEAGAVKISALSVLTAGGLIGLNAEGQLMCQLATPDAAGAVRPGTYYEQLTRRPYLLSVGVDAEGRLANCMVGNGALQHKHKREWLALKGRGFMLWMNDEDFKVDGAHYLGLVTSNQFAQDEEDGLTLLPATADRLAGVYKVSNPAEAARPAQTVLPLSVTETRYAHAEAVYDRVTADERFMSAAGGCKSIVVCKDKPVPPADEQEDGVLYIGLYTAR